MFEPIIRRAVVKPKTMINEDLPISTPFGFVEKFRYQFSICWSSLSEIEIFGLFSLRLRRFSSGFVRTIPRIKRASCMLAQRVPEGAGNQMGCVRLEQVAR
jgi:hypothetical protein